MKDDVGLVPFLTVSALVTLWFVWAALHDISHGESDCTLEYSILVLSVPVFALIHRAAFRILMPRGKAIWLAVTAALLVLFEIAAIEAWRHPKYPNDAAVGSLFLALTLPLLALVSWRLVAWSRAVLLRSRSSHQGNGGVLRR